MHPTPNAAVFMQRLVAWADLQNRFFRAECEKLFCKTNIKLLKLIIKYNEYFLSKISKICSLKSIIW